MTAIPVAPASAQGLNDIFGNLNNTVNPNGAQRRDDHAAAGRPVGAALRAHGVPSYGQVFGFKGSVVFHDTPSRNYRDFLRISTGVSHLHFLVQHNGGVFLPPWGKSESWTLSVAHTEDHGARYVRNVARVGELVAGLGDRRSDLFAVGSYN